MLDLLFPHGVIIIFIGALWLFILGFLAGTAIRSLRGFYPTAFVLLFGVIFSYLFYAGVLNLIG